jgi:sulfur-oxidizing protein SoxY
LRTRLSPPVLAAVVGRRDVLAGAGGLLSLAVVTPAAAGRPSLDDAVSAFAGGADVQSGRVTLDVARLVENGNAVPVTVTVESPMTAADHVRRIALFNEKNPQADVAVFHLGPRSGRARVSTRIRLATSQTVVAVAELSDGSFWSADANVVVTLAACIEDL